MVARRCASGDAVALGRFDGGWRWSGPMADEAPVLREHGNSYNIFILLLTVFSLAIVVVLLLPWIDQDTRDLLTFYDNVVCAIFLADFVYNLASSKPKRAYFFGARGWLDLLGSIPSLPGFPFTAILRLARLGRLARILRLLGGKNRKALIADVLQNRGSYAMFITILSAGTVLVISSILILQFESAAGDAANIQTGGDALWWGFVTMTTVGYGDRYPVTFLGRTTAVALMFAGVGIIGALASILASILVPQGSGDHEPDATAESGARAPVAGAPTTPDAGAVAEELALLRAEIAALRASLPGPDG
jgi:voltage-gated potassium channel